MEIIKTEIPDLIVIKPKVINDNRGLFFEAYNQKTFAEKGISTKFVQDNQSGSVKDTVRGLHMQNPNGQAKLVRVIKGKVLDVAVDVRIGSTTFGKWEAVELSEDNFLQLLVPRGFLHGFRVLSEKAEFLYKCDNFYSKADEITVKWDDPEIGIDWGIENPILSEKDQNGSLLKDVMDKLPCYQG